MAQERIIQINGKDVSITEIDGITSLENPLVNQKLYSREELAQQCEIWKKHNIKTAFTTGVFDLIHNGHMRYLQLAASLGDKLIVGLNSDKSVKNLKGPSRPILDQTIRAEALANLEYVHYISIFGESTGAELIRTLKPDCYLCVEGSWSGDIASKDEVIAMAEHGGKVYCAPRQHPLISTSHILERVGAAAVEDFKRQIENGK